MVIDKCPDCGEDVNPEDKFCPRCGLVFDDSPIYDTSGYDTYNEVFNYDDSSIYDNWGYDKNTGTYHEPLNDGQDLEMEMIHIELKYGYKSPAYRRFENLKQHYYDLFEEILLERGYKLYEVPDIFYSDFKQWYHLNSKSIGKTKRVDLIEQFLRGFEV